MKPTSLTHHSFNANFCTVTFSTCVSIRTLSRRVVVWIVWVFCPFSGLFCYLSWPCSMKGVVAYWRWITMTAIERITKKKHSSRGRYMKGDSFLVPFFLFFTSTLQITQTSKLYPNVHSMFPIYNKTIFRAMKMRVPVNLKRCMHCSHRTVALNAAQRGTLSLALSYPHRREIIASVYSFLLL